MGWDNAQSGGRALDDIWMSEQQRSLIVNLHEQLDGVRCYDHAQFPLPKWTKREASEEIDRLKLRLEIKKRKNS